LKIKLEYPYSEHWKIGYLVTNKENRKTLLLYNSHTDRSSTQYARYLLAVNIGRYLLNDECVDHIDNDKTNDDIKNLQILTVSENNKKQGKIIGHLMVELKCPNCGKLFNRYKNQVHSIKSGKLSFCSRKCGYILNHYIRNLSGIELENAQKNNIIKIYREHT